MSTELQRPDPLFNQSLEKGLEVLRAFNAVHRTLTLAELAELTGMTKSSAQRTVHTLERLGAGQRQRRNGESH
jgi:DNA-binding IclR family transcriptional regulator